MPSMLDGWKTKTNAVFRVHSLVIDKGVQVEHRPDTRFFKTGFLLIHTFKNPIDTQKFIMTKMEFFQEVYFLK